MNKTELISAMSENANMTKVDIIKKVDGVEYKGKIHIDNKEELYLGEPKEDKGLDLKPLKL